MRVQSLVNGSLPMVNRQTTDWRSTRPYRARGDHSLLCPTHKPPNGRKHLNRRNSLEQVQARVLRVSVLPSHAECDDCRVDAWR